jgi:predicted ATPase
MREDLPTGTVTFLFTDVEGSTQLLHELGPETYADELAEHRSVLRRAYVAHGGVEVDTQGDAFFFAFPTAQGALDAAAEGGRALEAGRIRVRVGIHTGTPTLTDEGYVGEDVHKGARIGAAGHGGQVLVSRETRELLRAELTDLGEHRLKDFATPVWIFQLGTERFPPLKTISNTNLPRPASSFVGREREVAEIATMLSDGARLLTLSGPGGSGKTRLAIEAAATLVPAFRNGVFWVGLSTLRDPDLVLDEVASILGASDGLAQHVGGRQMLLLLDNLEQVVDCAPGLATLVETCPNLRLLITSRELLRVRGEVDYPVPPLAAPEAVELFCERSGLAPDAVIAELCARLDSLPLAVELAAARTNLLSPAKIVERLSQRLDLFEGGRDADARQRTLRATIAWSYDLLTPKEQRLFARLGVFAGGCTLEAAEEICGADLATLQSLVEKSLLRHTHDRYWMLETIREFAVERLGASGEAAELRDHHAAWCLALAEEAEPHLRQEELEWIDRLEHERDNLGTALDHLEATGDHGTALRLVAVAWWIWSLKGHISEGRARVERVLANDHGSGSALAKALTGAADLAGDDEDLDASQGFGEEALALNRTLGDTWGVAYNLLGLGLIPATKEDFVSARPLFEESMRLFREAGDDHWERQATRRVAWSCESTGDMERARTLHQELIQSARVAGDAFSEARSLAVLAQFTLEAGRVDADVVALFGRAHELHRTRLTTLPDRNADAILLSRFAHALALSERWEAATQVLACADARFEEIGLTVEQWVVRMDDATRAMIQAHMDVDQVVEAQLSGRALTADEAVALATRELEAVVGR